MSYTYNNLYTETLRNSTFSMERSNFIGVAPSSNIIGGLQQVYSVDNFTFDYSGVGIGEIVKKESNSIPLYYIPGGTEQGEEVCIPFVGCFPGEDIITPDRLLLNNDGFSSGRLKNGTIVYCYEKKQAYQFLIDNYNTLYDAASAESGNFTSTQYNFTVLSGTTATDNFISAWINHKVEGELKNPGDPSQGTWSRDEANWKKYPNVPEYFTINAVPASEEVDGFKLEDAYIVVPQEWDGKKVISVEASFFSVPASPNSLSGSCQISLTQTNLDPNGSTITSNISFDHNKGEKASTSAFSSPLQLIGNSTLHLSVDSSFGSDHKGYTATFKVIS